MITKFNILMPVKDTFFSKKLTLNIKGRLFFLNEPKIMGVLNVTPDSFYTSSRKSSSRQALAHADHLISAGADIIDIGAYSSRPGADDITEKEELERIIPVVGNIREKYPNAIISIDTFRSGIARPLAEKYHVDMINDISAGDLDPEMLPFIADYQLPFVMMHMKGTPQTMQQQAVYNDVIKEIMIYFAEKVNICKETGIHDVVLDPGFGFGKTIAQNFEILKNLKKFEMFELPVLVGLSRKSMVYKTLNQSPEEALTGTVVLNALALQNGANILRVHDVVEARNTIMMMKRYLQTENEGDQ
jgi:dihydropteroate synthase